MQDAARQFLTLLDRERTAACEADVETLVGLQNEKSRLLGQLRTEGASDALLEQLTAAAEANIVLMRHLVVCLRGLLEGVESPSQTYTAAGTRNAQAGGYGTRGG